MSPTPAYDQLAAASQRLYHFAHLASITRWDQETNMPPGGNEARGAALAELAALMHRLHTEPGLGEQIGRAEQEPLDDVQRANLREMRREWRQSTALPEALVQARTLAASRCEHAWRAQRQANDWKGFLANFRDVMRLAREEAELLSQLLGVSKYEALMDRFEPGMSCAEVDRVFGDLKTWLPGLVRRAQERQAAEKTITPIGPFSTERQKALCERVTRLLGFDFSRGRLDVSTHPFSGGVPETCA